MNAEPDNEDVRSHILHDTLQQISSTAAGANTKCCVICLGDVVEQCEAQPCQHNDFDFLCLLTWLETRATCPLCKSDLCEVRYDLGEDGKHGKFYKASERVEGRSEEGLHEAALPSGFQSSTYPNHSTGPRQYDSEAIRRRRLIYRRQLYSLHVDSNKRQPAKSRYKELSPQLFAKNPELISRARIWLRRELRVFRRKPCNAEYLLEYIMTILKSIDMQGSAGQAEEMIHEFLGRDNTRLLLHELRAWLRSPCKSLSELDRVVQYPNGNAMPRVLQKRREEIRNGDAQPRRPTTSLAVVFRRSIPNLMLGAWT
ncbi:hypothetical protein C8A03DRAFT_46759 [Achaetomium macrosporum]|uniref:RING-type E3 ubiquitin transferase n=1 Tax=Achaetomium macrosporum TaxID=79813 RepID=A0AAN7C5Y5_9PEZI|nr:hypothetical protein C8A03DRAFT_46759 [Achaetomium macrosporum]